MTHPWLDEFYPEPAECAAERGTEAALEHSLRKWRGATGENLAKHGVWRADEEQQNGRFYDQIALWDDCGDQVIVFGVKTCALCELFSDDGCVKCPLYKNDETCYHPGRGYDVFAKGGGPEVMIAELEAALAAWKEKYGKH